MDPDVDDGLGVRGPSLPDVTELIIHMVVKCYSTCVWGRDITDGTESLKNSSCIIFSLRGCCSRMGRLPLRVPTHAFEVMQHPTLGASMVVSWTFANALLLTLTMAGFTTVTTSTRGLLTWSPVLLPRLLLRLSVC